MTAPLTPEEREALFVGRCHACEQGVYDIEPCRCAEMLHAAVERVIAHRERAAREEERARVLGEVAAELKRNHDMPPKKDGRSYSYRNGWWDGIHHAAAVVKARGGAR